MKVGKKCMKADEKGAKDSGNGARAGEKVKK